MPRLAFSALLVAALAALGGCASVPQNAAQSFARMQGAADSLPTEPKSTLSQSDLHALAAQLPTEALLRMVLQSQDGKPVILKLAQPAGYMPGADEGALTQEQRDARLAAVTAGVSAGGRIGGATVIAGLLIGVGNNTERYGVMPVVNQPTLDFYRPLTPSEQKMPLRGQSALYQEELDIIAALHDGRQTSCLGVQCMKIDWKPLGDHSWAHQNLYDYPLMRVGEGGFFFRSNWVAQFSPKGVPVGDNGLMALGIDSSTGWAVVLPSMLPDNTYFSPEKLAALARKYPQIGHWYAVFNAPVSPGSSKYVWTVMHEGKIVGTGVITMVGT